MSAGWLAAQRREESLLNRVPKLIVAIASTVALALAALVACGLVAAIVAAPAIAACLAAAAPGGRAIWRGERELEARIDAERLRVERLRADQEGKLIARQAEHARQASRWRARRFAFERQKRWYAVRVPDGIDRVDIAGGTLSGWSALLTMTAAHRLAAGGEITVVDLSGGAVAGDLVDLAAAGGAAPAVWVLPRDLPRLDLAASLAPGELADVLALSVSVAQERSSARDLAIDTAILERLIGVLDGAGDGAGDAPSGAAEGGAIRAAGGVIQIARVAAALRALAQVGDPRTDVAAGLLSEREAGTIGALFGQGATDRVVLERALGMEAQLRMLAEVGSEPVRLPRGRLRVVAVDKRASALSATLLGSFVVTALTHLITRLPDVDGKDTGGQDRDGQDTGRGASWQHAVVLLGAERLRDDVLDRLTDACESARCGLVLAYRSIPPQVRQRIGRGNAAVAFMRLGNAEEAKAASEQIGSEHRFVLSQLTETIGTSVTDTAGGSYTSTAGDSASAAVSTSDSESSSSGGGQSRPANRGFPLAEGASGSVSTQTGTTRGTSESASLTAGISTSTAWGLSTSRATGDSESLARSLQRSRELVVEPSELQRLPLTAMIVSYANATGRRVLLADANPAIGTLPVATLTPLRDLNQDLNAAGTPERPQQLTALTHAPAPHRPGVRPRTDSISRDGLEHPPPHTTADAGQARVYGWRRRSHRLPPRGEG